MTAHENVAVSISIQTSVSDYFRLRNESDNREVVRFGVVLNDQKGVKYDAMTTIP